ncbi:MAG: radical SAM/Cys-rich domain protein [Coriobacteriales bacterium]|jgi:MoaA/NifB/PqqE/SkfB family radical SAM enzyme|nr:radical SAM/Cys-rich domain protein [Coriobacteriales bacterium]
MPTSEPFEHLPFALKVEAEGVGCALRTAQDLGTMQLNITKRCNLACKHCHVGSGPGRDEEADKAALQACLDVFASGPFVSMDVTGGAPELNTYYRWLIEEASRIMADKRARGQEAQLITRTNAAILTEPGFEDLPEFWARHGVELAASLPHYEEHKTDRMRGEGVFAQVIAGLRMLNAVGYGAQGRSSAGSGVANGESAGSDTGDGSNKENSALVLNLVVNPGGAILPPPQASAEREFKKELGERYGISFDNLLVITNNPVGRFRDFLERRGMLDSYMIKLYDAFNPATVAAAMCRSQISVDTDGRLYDCDFNQIVNLPILTSCQDDHYPTTDVKGWPLPALTIFDLKSKGLAQVSERRVRVGGHCFACTAGAGSSCGGATA